MAKQSKKAESQDVDLYTEKCVIAGLIKEEPFKAALSDLNEDDFILERSRIIFKTCLELARGNKPINLVSVSNALRDSGDLAAVGGLSYLVELDEISSGLVANEQSVKQMLITVKRNKARRSLIATFDVLTEELAINGDVESIIKNAYSRLRSIAENYKLGTATIQTVSEILDKHGGLDAAFSNGEDGILLPWKTVQKYTGRIKKKQYWIVAGRPSAGKTSMSLQIAVEAALHNRPTLFVSLEMNNKELLEKACAMLSGIKPSSKDLDTEARAAISAAITRLDSAPLSFMETKNRNPYSLRAEIENFTLKSPVDLVIIDYMQLIRTNSRSTSRNEELAAVSEMLKGIANDLDVGLLLASQLSRNVARDGREPDLHDLRDSGALEQDADIVILLHRSPKTKHDPLKKVKVIIGKNRFGPTGDVELWFSGKISRFEEDSYDLQK